MKKFIILIAAIVLVFGIWVFTLKYFGDFLPSVLPGKKLTNIIKQNDQEPLDNQTGEPVGFPLKLPEGYEIGVFADGVDNARDLQFSPGGTLLVSETESGKVVALPDVNKDGVADDVVIVINNLNKPHGLLFDRDEKSNNLYVAEETRLVRYIWDENHKTTIFDKEIVSLPPGGRHYTRSMAMDNEGKIYISIGSTCDTCFEKNPYNGSVIVTDRNGQNTRIFSKGLRNAVFLAKNPNKDEIWATEMGRDFLGDDSPPDEINILKDGADYGWPVCYGDKAYDSTFDQKSSSFCQQTTAPVYDIPAHSAPLGLTFIDSKQMPSDWHGDLLVAYHGSWNRSVPTGYKIVKLDINGDKVVGAEDFITGFLQGSNALGRPVDMTFDQQGSLYISDDKSGAVYKVVKK